MGHCARKRCYGICHHLNCQPGDILKYCNERESR
ncbi:helix-turn-helix domain-containing protein [Escherichia coli]